MVTETEDSLVMSSQTVELGSFPKYVLVFSGICSGSSAAAAAELESTLDSPLLFLLGRAVRTKEA